MLLDILLWVVAPATILYTWLFLLGVLPLPWGYERGKVRWLKWCGTGRHFCTVYVGENGFQTLHPRDAGGDAGE